MLLFSTILDMNAVMKEDDFINVVFEWNQSNPRKENIIPDLTYHHEPSIRYEHGQLSLAIETYQKIIAVRYEKREKNGTIWDSDYVMNFTTHKLSIQLERSYTEEALDSDGAFSTPHLITLLIEKGYVKKDGKLPVLRTPIMIAEDQLNLLASIITNQKRYRLPVVYVSKTHENENPVDIDLLAARLKGVAHVLVQESTSTNPELKELCQGENEYFGAVGIYYPNPAIKHRRYMYRTSQGYRDYMLEKIIKEVVSYANAIIIEPLYTWQGVNNALLKDRLDLQIKERKSAESARKEAEEKFASLRAGLDEEEDRIRQEALDQALNEANDLIAEFDDELQTLRQRVEALTHANEVLQVENQGLKAKLDATHEIPLLKMGDEYEFYQGEIKDLILMVLLEAGHNMDEDSRRHDVVHDVIMHNDDRKTAQQKAETVKRLLKNYTGITAKLRQELMDLGFVITEEGKHYKITYYGDNRYQIVLGKTPSDHRSGLNNALTIIKKCF